MMIRIPNTTLLDLFKLSPTQVNTKGNVDSRRLTSRFRMKRMEFRPRTPLSFSRRRRRRKLRRSLSPIPKKKMVSSIACLSLNCSLVTKAQRTCFVSHPRLDYSLANHSKSTREPLSPRKMFTSSSSNQTKKPPSLFSSFTPPQDPISTSKKFFTKSEKARGKERAVEEPVEEVVEENDWDDMEWETITPSTSKPTSAPSTSTSSFAYGGGGGGGNPKKKQSKLAFTSFFATPSASSSKASTSKSASTSSSTSSSFKGKNKGKGNESEPFKESVPVFREFSFHHFSPSPSLRSHFRILSCCNSLGFGGRR